MKVLFQALGMLAIVLSFNACKTSSPIDSAHNSQNSLDWAGIYKGKSSGNDSKEQVSVIKLENDLTYSMQTAIVDEYDKSVDSNGTFVWNKSGSEITLKDKNTGKQIIIKVGENKIIEKGGNTLFTMDKIINDGIVNKYWKLIEINGKPVVMNEKMRREPHIILNGETNRMSGTGGCNNMTSSFELETMNRIKFGKAASTLMACPDMEIESQLLGILEMVDNYTLSADGKTLLLNKARMAPLARFEVVYLR